MFHFVELAGIGGIWSQLKSDWYIGNAQDDIWKSCKSTADRHLYLLCVHSVNLYLHRHVCVRANIQVHQPAVSFHQNSSRNILPDTAHT